MKILYVTDLHGVTWKRWRVLELAQQHQVQLVIDGGDILPGDDSFNQQGFLRGPFAEFCKAIALAKIYYLTMLGNDDLRIFDAQFDQILAENRQWLFNLAQKRVTVGGYEFIGFNLVVDNPFRLKDRCRLDYRGAPIGKQFGEPFVFEGLITRRSLPNWPSYVRRLPTIQDELEKLPQSENIDKTVYVIHHPPFGVNLGTVCRRRKIHIKKKMYIKKTLVDLGSKSVRAFIKKRQPLLTLHGHIHESPSLTNVWQARIGRTICIQPGQGLSEGELNYVIIELETLDFNYYKDLYPETRIETVSVEGQ